MFLPVVIAILQHGIISIIEPTAITFTPLLVIWTGRGGGLIISSRAGRHGRIREQDEISKLAVPVRLSS